MTHPTDPLTPAHDEFERYYAEKIWDWIPAVYRDEDGLALHPDVLREMVEILARQAAIARRSSDRLWEDAFIERCDDWAIPYLGDLVGTRLVNELNRRGRRVDVAQTIFYRRRKGTLLVLELLIQDIADWEGRIVESFRRLGRTRHGLDPEPMELLGPISQTPSGGWANLRSVRGANLVDGPFDEFAHTPDFRQLRGKLGRYNIPKLNFHLYRLVPFEVRFATPADLGDGRFTFDPSGRDIPLFRPDQRLGSQDCRVPQEWQLPSPIPCRLLGDVRYTISTDTIDELVSLGLVPAAAEELSRYVGILFRHEVRLRQTIASLSQATAILALFDRLLATAITPDSPKAYLIPSPIQSDPTAIVVAVGTDPNPATPVPEVPPIEHQRIASANLADWGVSLGILPPEKTLVIDPERGRFWFPTVPTDPIWIPTYHYGLSGNIGAGTYDRQTSLDANVSPISAEDINDPGPIAWSVPSLASPLEVNGFEFQDSKTYQPNSNVILGIDCVTFQAANLQRPYLQRSAPGVEEWVFISPDDPPPEDSPLGIRGTPHPRSLTLNGLWIGINPSDAIPSSIPCTPVSATLVLEGSFDCVTIRHCTLDPGGEQARGVDQNQCLPIPYVQLVIRRGTVEDLIIESSILGPIHEDSNSDPPGTIQRLTVRDSIIHSIDPAQVSAIETALGGVTMKRVTVFGDVVVKELFASESLIQGLVQVTDNQHGCFRFSATHEHPQKRLPPQFESHFFAPAIPNHFFVSRQFGHPGYGQLSDTAPQALVRGAENRSEIGAFSNLLNPIKLEDLSAKVAEFMPFGLIAQFINET